jgi:hypothetical protein
MPDGGTEREARSLLPHHLRLIVSSAISDDVAKARGYYSAEKYSDVKILGFAERQVIVPALVIPVWDVTGRVALYQTRPDSPRLTSAGKAIKYETAKGARMVVDVPPVARTRLGDPSEELWITEGARKADAAVSAGLCCIGLLGVYGWRGKNHDGGKTALPCWESIALNGRPVYLCFDSDVMTKEAVRKALLRLGRFLEQHSAQVHVVFLPPGEGGGKVGLDDYLAAGHTIDELRALGTTRPKAQSTVPTVAPHVDDADKAAPTGPPPPLAPLLDRVVSILQRYVVFQKPEQATAVALWVARTYAFEHFDSTPYLAVTSAEKRSGKTRLLDVLEVVVARPWRQVMPSEAVVYRKIAADKPTLMLDEVDAIYGPKAREHEGLRALLNAGYRRGTTVPRCVGKGADLALQDFEVFCPKALAGIGTLPDTISDRSIPIRLARRTQSEPVAKFRHRDGVKECAPIRLDLECWAKGIDLREARPSIPEELGDRAADFWEPLLAIADLAGGEWPEQAREAARRLHSEQDDGEVSLGVRLLADLKAVFDWRNGEAIFTDDLLQSLNELDDAPWGDFRGKPMDARRLARILKSYGIKPITVRIGEEVKKGYQREHLEPAWERYVSTSLSPSQEGVHPSQRYVPESSRDFGRPEVACNGCDPARNAAQAVTASSATTEILNETVGRNAVTDGDHSGETDDDRGDTEWF